MNTEPQKENYIQKWAEKAAELSKCLNVMPPDLATMQIRVYNLCLDMAYHCEKDYDLHTTELEKGIGRLRQWLNEDRITDINKMVDNQQIKVMLGLSDAITEVKRHE